MKHLQNMLNMEMLYKRGTYMKCNYKRSYDEALNKKWEQQKKEYDEWFNSLSEAEQQKVKQESKESVDLLFNFPYNKYY